MTITRTHSAYHLGDNLVHLNFLRRVAKANPGRQFVHYAQWQYLPELRPLIEDVPNISLSDLNHMLPSGSINAWRGANGHWYQHPDRLDFVKYHIESWFPYLADRMGVENPVKTREDMLFDYPALKSAILPPELKKPFDVLVINSAPGSGQFHGFDQFMLGEIAIGLSSNGSRVITTAPLPQPGFVHPVCTADFPLNCTQIGALSLLCHTILMVSTGPTWPTFNIHNVESVKHRIILLTSERVELAPNTVHCDSVLKAAEELKKIGLL